MAGPPALARRWPLARAAVKSGGFLVIAAAVAHSGNIIDNSVPNGPGPHHGWTRLLLLLTLTVVVTALVILIRGVAASVEQRRSRRQLPRWPPSPPISPPGRPPLRCRASRPARRAGCRGATPCGTSPSGWSLA